MELLNLPQSTILAPRPLVGKVSGSPCDFRMGANTDPSLSDRDFAVHTLMGCWKQTGHWCGYDADELCSAIGSNHSRRLTTGLRQLQAEGLIDFVPERIDDEDSDPRCPDYRQIVQPTQALVDHLTELEAATPEPERTWADITVVVGTPPGPDNPTVSDDQPRLAA